LRGAIAGGLELAGSAWRAECVAAGAATREDRGGCGAGDKTGGDGSGGLDEWRGSDADGLQRTDGAQHRDGLDDLGFSLVVVLLPAGCDGGSSWLKGLSSTSLPAQLASDSVGPD
jgi:hypothetical protein